MQADKRNWRAISGAAVAMGITAFGWHRWHTRWSLGLFFLAAAMFGVALALPRIWAPFQAVLDRLVRGVVVAVTWLLLGIVFAACFIPGRLVMAVLRRDPLCRMREPARDSYLNPLPPPGGRERFRRQF